MADHNANRAEAAEPEFEEKEQEDEEEKEKDFVFIRDDVAGVVRPPYRGKSPLIHDDELKLNQVFDSDTTITKQVTKSSQEVNRKDPNAGPKDTKPRTSNPGPAQMSSRSQVNLGKLPSRVINKAPAPPPPRPSGANIIETIENLELASPGRFKILNWKALSRVKILNCKAPSRLVEGMKKNKTPIFWVLGGPGSGKGTQCSMLVEKYNFVHLSSGDLLRDEVAGESDIGQMIKGIMAKGELVPREIVLELIKNAMVKRLPSAAGFLIDGYPREIPQAEEFEDQIAPSSLIIYFDCKDETMLGRLLKRAQTSGRSDDNEETIKKRIDTFHQVSEPVMQKYAGKVATIPAETSTDQIFAACCAEVNKTLTAAGKEVPA